MACCSAVQSLSFVQLFVTPWTAACQASLSIMDSQSLLKLMFIKSVMTFNHLILCHPLLLLPPIFPNIMVISKGSVIHIRWPKYWSFSFSISLTKKAARQRISAFNRGVGEDSRAPWTARRSNQSLVKEINPEYSL